MSFNIAPVEMWRKQMTSVRDTYAPRSPLVVVVGSGLSYGRELKIGVSDVSTIVDWLREMDIPIANGSPSKQYQDGMRALKLAGTPWAVGSITRRAILQAHKASARSRELRKVAEQDPSHGLKNACQELEKLSGEWVLPDGVTGLAGWLAGIVRVRRNNPSEKTGPIHVVTTNFDPLIEVALSALGDINVTSLSIPGNTPQEPTSCDVCVWHVHGAWWDVTLHEESALQQHRQWVAQKLAERMKYAQICVLGYGGWQDVVSTTIADILGMSGGQPSIGWAFFEPDEKEILTKYSDPLARLASAPAFSQTTLFGGINLHRELLALVAPGVANARKEQPTSDTNVPTDLLDRLRDATKELLDVTPKHAQSKLNRLLTIDRELPDLCVVLAELCLVLGKIEARDSRRHFAFCVLEVVSALSACVLEIGPREAAPGTENGDALVVESSLIAELRMAAEHQRALRLKTNDTGVVPTDAVDDCDLSRPLESGPADDDWVEAFQRRFWAMDHPHIDFDKQKHEAKLDGLLEGKKLLHEERFAVTESDVPVGALRQKIPHARFFIRGTSGSMSPAIREHTLATLIQELLKHAPELSPDVAPTKEPLR